MQYRKAGVNKRTSGVISPPGTIPTSSSALPVSYASDTAPFAHCVIATITHLFDASRRASIKSLRCGAFPDPKVSMTTPTTGGFKKARIVSAVIPGNNRIVAIEGTALTYSLPEDESENTPTREFSSR